MKPLRYSEIVCQVNTLNLIKLEVTLPYKLYNLAIVEVYGCPKDYDGDGVPDYLDKTPTNTPIEISKGVDATGVPLDRDGDFIPDYSDKCPNTPADLVHKVDSVGCRILDTEQ